jgi:glycosyltransferase involved in cell wall biosynthesis
MVTKNHSMAIVRAYRPNLAEISVYRPFLERFKLTFFFSGLDPEDSRNQLDGFGLNTMRTVGYTSPTDLVPSGFFRRVVDFKIGFGSYMLTHLSEVLSHDYINVVDPIFGFTYQIAGSIRPDQKLIVVRWENIYGRYERVWMAAHRANRVLRRADLIVCISRASLSTLCIPQGFSGKVVQIYPGIDLRGVNPNGSRVTARDTQSTSNKRFPTILFVGRLQWTKGLQVLLVAMRILRERAGLETDLWVIGGGDQAPFQKLTKELGLRERVQFLGTLSNREVRGKMAEADLFCFPSLLSPNWMEQYGFALVEAMAHGLPVVTFDSGSIREICGEDAVYASTGNAHSLAEGIAKILENRAEALVRGERLRQRAFREFDADQQGKKLLEVIP